MYVFLFCVILIDNPFITRKATDCEGDQWSFVCFSFRLRNVFVLFLQFQNVFPNSSVILVKIPNVITL